MGCGSLKSSTKNNNSVFDPQEANLIEEENAYPHPDSFLNILFQPPPTPISERTGRSSTPVLLTLPRVTSTLPIITERSESESGSHRRHSYAYSEIPIASQS